MHCTNLHTLTATQNVSSTAHCFTFTRHGRVGPAVRVAFAMEFPMPRDHGVICVGTVVCSVCPARRLGFCRALDDEALRLLSGRCRIERFGAGQPVLPPDGSTERIGILISGRVKVVRPTESGEDQVLALLAPGDMVGSLEGEETGLGWDAATIATVCLMPRSRLLSLCRDVPEALPPILEVAQRQLKVQRLWNAALRGRGAVERVAGWLMACLPPNRPDGVEITLTVKRRDLASLLDMTIETLCRSFNRLEAGGALTLLSPRRVIVLDARKLAAEAGGDTSVWSALAAMDQSDHPGIAAGMGQRRRNKRIPLPPDSGHSYV